MHHNSIIMFIRQKLLNDEHLFQTEIIPTKWCCSKADKVLRKTAGLLIPFKFYHGYKPFLCPTFPSIQAQFDSVVRCSISWKKKNISKRLGNVMHTRIDPKISSVYSRDSAYRKVHSEQLRKIFSFKKKSSKW